MTLATVRDRLAGEHGREGGARFASAWCAALDGWLADTFAAALAVSERGGGLGVGCGFALVAVGGTGRGDLAPGSDVDLMLLHDRRVDPSPVAEALWYPVWDEGLRLGQSVRTEAGALGLAAEDLVTATALLSCRHVAGDPEMTASLAAAAAAQWRNRSKWALGALREQAVQRWAAWGELAFLLEGDLKESRGGLRDVHSLRWADAAAPLLERDDAVELADAERVLFDVRVALHAVTGGHGDRFGLAEQDEVAVFLGVEADDLARKVSAAARRVAWVADETWDRVGVRLAAKGPLLGWRSRSRAPGVVVRAGQVLLEPDLDPAVRPEAVFDVADAAVRTGARPARDTLRRLAERTPLPPMPWPAWLRERFVGLLLAGHRAVPVVESLDHVGLWARYMPEWDDVRSRPQRNAYHRFTVDRHLLETAAGAAAFADRVGRPDLLVLAGLLHDLGKGRGGDHSVVGAEVARGVAQRIGLDAADSEVLVRLVRHHLLLADVATRRDLGDPATITAVADAVGDRVTLGLLGALTEADSIATGPSAWSSWKAPLVADLLRRVDMHLAGVDPGVFTVEQFPSARQLELVAAAVTDVGVEDGRVCVVAPDRPGLLCRVAGALALLGLEVRSADAAVLGGFAVEQFGVESSLGLAVDAGRVEGVVRDALADRLAVEARLAERERTYGSGRALGRSTALAPPVVRFDDSASASATVVEVHAPDRSGLLYRLARAFAEFSLDVSQVRAVTVGDVAVDAFYVTHGDGSLVTDPGLRSEVERALLHAVA